MLSFFLRFLERASNIDNMRVTVWRWGRGRFERGISTFLDVSGSLGIAGCRLVLVFFSIRSFSFLVFSAWTSGFLCGFTSFLTFGIFAFNLERFSWILGMRSSFGKEIRVGLTVRGLFSALAGFSFTVACGNFTKRTGSFDTRGIIGIS